MQNSHLLETHADDSASNSSTPGPDFSLLGREGSAEGGPGERGLERGLGSFDFTDLTIGPEGEGADYSGGPWLSRPVAGSHLPLVDSLREAIRARHEEVGRDYFRITQGDVDYRVQLADTVAGPWWHCRRLEKDIPDYGALAIDGWVRDYLDLAMTLPGLLIVFGEQGAGKTTFLSSLFRENLRRHGGNGITVESPAELPLQGRHGAGRCLQQEVPDEEDVPAYLKRALRLRARLIFLGETRWRSQADQLLLAAKAGLQAMTSFHGGSFADVAARFAGLADPD